MNLMDIQNDVARTNADGHQANREGLASMQVDGQDNTQLHLSLMQQLQAQNELPQHYLGQISQSLNQAMRSQSLMNDESVIPTSLNAQDQQMNSWLTELESQQRQQIDTGQVDADQVQQQREQMKTNQMNQAPQEPSVPTHQPLDVAQQQSIKAHDSSFIDPIQQQMTLLQCLLSINQQNTCAQTIYQHQPCPNTIGVAGIEGAENMQYYVNLMAHAQQHDGPTVPHVDLSFNALNTKNSPIQQELLQPMQCLQPQQGQVPSQQAEQAPVQQSQDDSHPVKSNTVTEIATRTKHIQKKASTKTAKTKAVIKKHRQATQVIGNTMKSLNDTMDRIHSGMQGIDQAEHMANKKGQHQVISGSMKSLSSTLACSRVEHPETLVNATWDNSAKEEKYLINQNKYFHDDTPLRVGANVHPSPSSLDQSYPSLLAQNAYDITSNAKIVSSDTDSENFAGKRNTMLFASQKIQANQSITSSQKRGTNMTFDKYVSKCGTDDDVMLSATHSAAIDQIASAGTALNPSDEGMKVQLAK